MSKPELNELLEAIFSEATWAQTENEFGRIIRPWLDPRSGQPFPPRSNPDRMDLDCGHIPESGISIPHLVDQLGRLLENSPKHNHPRYLGHMTQALPVASVALDALTAALNQNQVKLETALASSKIETQTIEWFHKMVFGLEDEFYESTSPGSALGNMVSGGTMGNFTALATALGHALPGVRKDGLVKAMRAANCESLAILGSVRLHYSLKKAAASLGLGSDAVQVVPVDEYDRVDARMLRDRAIELHRTGTKILAVVGIAGATETGSIDPLDELADIAQDFGAWFHVDAAWGGALMISEAHRHLFRGIERADSVVLDGHKLFFVTMSQGTVLFREQHSLDVLRHHANYILRPDSSDLGQTSLEGSRRFDALKLWATIRLLGAAGYSILFARFQGLCRQMVAKIDADPCFELITKSDTFILTYRYIPRTLRERLLTFQSQGDTEGLMRVNDEINDLNVAIQNAMKSEGVCFVSRTALEHTKYPGRIDVLRMIITNPWTEEGDLNAILNEQKRLAESLSRHG